MADFHWQIRTTFDPHDPVSEDPLFVKGVGPLASETMTMDVLGRQTSLVYFPLWRQKGRPMCIVGALPSHRPAGVRLVLTSNYNSQIILVLHYNVIVARDVEVTDEFKAWWSELAEAERISVGRAVLVLEERGPHLPFPYSSGVNGSRHSAMRELRVQHQGHPSRVLYIFDPRRVALLLLGDDKTGDDRWYEKNVPLEEEDNAKED
jgi:hypothetical protein